MANIPFVPSKETEQVEMLPGIHRRTMAFTERTMLCQFFLERDSAIPPHSHPNDQVGYVVFGKVELTIGEETRICGPSDSYAIPGGVVHSARPKKDTLLIESFAPARDDYRKNP